MSNVPGLLPPLAPVPAAPAAAGRATLPDRAELAALRGRIDRALAQYLARQRGELARQPVAAALFDDLAEFSRRPGKRLRPVLFFLAARIFAPPDGAGWDETALMPIAVGLELLHAFILVHDDLIDRAETRRDQPTLHRVIETRLPGFGDRARVAANLALVGGDVLFALAQRSMLEAPLPAALHAPLSAALLGCLVETGFGQAADIFYGTRDVAKVGPAEIEQMYLLKTTCYTIGSPLRMAALLGGVDASGLESLSRIARPAGLAFQMQNDVLEFARFEVSDAAIPADLLEGKKTLLLRAAYDGLGDSDRGLLQLCLGAGAPTESTLSKIRELVVRSGAVGRVRDRMDELFVQAEAEVARAPFSPTVRAQLSGLLHLVRESAPATAPNRA